MAWTPDELDTALTEQFAAGHTYLLKIYGMVEEGGAFPGITKQDVVDSAGRLLQAGIIENRHSARVPRNPNLNYWISRAYRLVEQEG